jgi:hypothetical protein
MARKSIIKTPDLKVEELANNEDVQEIVESSEEQEVVEMVVESVVKKEIVTTIREIKTMKLDEYHEIVIEVSSDYWVKVYWLNENTKSLLVLFEINHSTTDADISRDSKKFVHDKFIYLAQKTFTA